MLEPKKSDIQTLSAVCRPKYARKSTAGTALLSPLPKTASPASQRCQKIHLLKSPSPSASCLELANEGHLWVWKVGEKPGFSGHFLDWSHTCTDVPHNSFLGSLETTHSTAAGWDGWKLPRDSSELQRFPRSFQEPPLWCFGQRSFLESSLTSFGHHTSSASLLDLMARDLRRHSGPCA